ncbi:MAG TPA: hypothetical protein VIE65_13915 [Methylobacter sp.]|jgi:hypothetical protein
MSGKIQVIGPRKFDLPSDDFEIKLGQWYWVSPDDGEENKEEWFGCVLHIGSNYVQINSPKSKNTNYYSDRIHLDEFWNRCRHEPDPDSVINNNIQASQQRIHILMEEVKELTARLAISPSPELGDGQETKALALANSSNRDFDSYKKDLVKAQKKILPELFNEIEAANNKLASWLTAKLLPIQAEAEKMKSSMNQIEERIFSVEIYAGLTEEVVRVRDGDPAPLSEQVRLMQRRHYMDEECLANYKTGGMNFKGIKGFDKWLSRSENFNRILPFPRCVVAFRIRRNRESFEGELTLGNYIRFAEMQELNESTFLYIRNGEILYRLQTVIDFEEKLFPDLDAEKLRGKVYGYGFVKPVDRLVSEGEYLEALREADEEDLKIAEQECREEIGEEEPSIGGHFNWKRHEVEKYIPFDRNTVYYDDIRRKIADEMKRHNQIALIIQGLLDRSPVFHPHPPWQIWTEAGFKSALIPIYDESRALATGEVPDFEAYRAKLNESLSTGSVTVGQENYWEIVEAEKEADRLDRDHRTRSSYRVTRFRPYGNPGPGCISKVAKFSPKLKACTYEWMRERIGRSVDNRDGIRVSIIVPVSSLLNVSSYKPGDFKIFFNDPRTRADYLKWAPLLLEAEEYHAGNRQVQEPPLASSPQKSSFEGQRRYLMRKKRKALMGKAVRLVYDVTLRSGTIHKKGTLWRVIRGAGTKFDLIGILDNGEDELSSANRPVRSIIEVRFSAFEMDPTIPGRPENNDRD